MAVNPVNKRQYTVARLMVVGSRLLLLLLLALVAWLAFTPGLNLARFTPAQTMRWIGFDYQQILGYEQHLLSALHLVIGFLGTLLLFSARLFFVANDRRRLAGTVLAGLLACVVLEGLQPLVGRSPGFGDLSFGFLGVALAGFGIMVIRRQQW